MYTSVISNQYKYLGVAADIFVSNITNVLSTNVATKTAAFHTILEAEEPAKNRQRFKYLESTTIKTTLYIPYGLPK